MLLRFGVQYCASTGTLVEMCKMVQGCGQSPLQQKEPKRRGKET